MIELFTKDRNYSEITKFHKWNNCPDFFIFYWEQHEFVIVHKDQIRKIEQNV